MIGYPLDELYEEIAFLAYYLHWDYETLVAMDHAERRRWCEEVSKINKRIGAPKGGGTPLIDLGADR